ncbi:uncharacterized protein CANTADRAFT_145712 [Suhomyces tanzawaensis NRRL Y-17324]|uniref:Uncharacterized protein n=1 Tax=Suhomyces tanzawaensis NRRL Y-17324 TaxID=984487 RepID=A0A1E4SSG1_9ASCO|nr:uncharacterized protein CANTADRAFT_145712 [Suhomyces tanzawaensis NRRL Y-17324]ODV82435.1 hypothetical protein CANTADRAFT_145712 [Suhomyces tanzawaensis NRRL Y-17324]
MVPGGSEANCLTLTPRYYSGPSRWTRHHQLSPISSTPHVTPLANSLVAWVIVLVMATAPNPFQRVLSPAPHVKCSSQHILAGAARAEKPLGPRTTTQQPSPATRRDTSRQPLPPEGLIPRQPCQHPHACRNRQNLVEYPQPLYICLYLWLCSGTHPWLWPYRASNVFSQSQAQITTIC